MNQADAAGQTQQYRFFPGMRPASSQNWQTGVGAMVLLMALWLGAAAWQIPATASDADMGGGLVPKLCAVALGVCGLWLIWEARHGGWRNTGAANSMAGMQVAPCIWVSAGLLSNALWMPQIGFVLSCALCYLLAVQGLRRAAQENKLLDAKSLLRDAALGLVVSILVLFLFTRVLGISLPTLTKAGWL